MIPNPLYKYVSSDRLDILFKGQIRFSQPSVWNDPFESQPFHKDYTPKNPLVQLQKLGSLLDRIRKSKEIPPDEIEEYQRESTKISKEDIYSYIQRNIVGLSLTEDKENLLMWAHYAAEHTGFVIEFDTNHPFFHNNDKYLFKVTCDDLRPEIPIAEFTSIVLDIVGLIKDNREIPVEYYEKISKVFRKSLDWEYEKEWRLITTTDKSLNYSNFKNKMNVMHLGADSEIASLYTGNSYLALLEIPISCIRAIYCGKRMLISNIRKLYFLTKYNQHFSHIRLLRAEIDNKFYKLNFKEVQGYDVLKISEFAFEQNNYMQSSKNGLSPSLLKYKRDKKLYSSIIPVRNGI